MSKWTKGEKTRMESAIQCALRSKCDNRHGCVVTKKYHYFGHGWNKDKTHPAAAACHSQCIHAELAAIIMCDETKLRGCDIYVARVMRSKGEALGMSRPCKMCMEMIRASNIRKMYYTTRDGSWAMEKV